MIATEQSTASGAGVSEKSKSPTRIFAEIAQKAVERAAETQKVMLDLMKEQETAAIDAARALIPGAGAGAFAGTVDVVRKSAERIAEAGKGSIDLAVRQSGIISEAVADSADRLTTDVQGMFADAFKEAGDTVLAAQKSIFDLAAKQAELASDILKQPVTEANKAERTVVDSASASIRKGVDIMFEAQKQFLDIAARPVKTRAARGGNL